MASASTIEWTDVTWNPVTGCDKVSDGCRNCYAEPLAARLKAMGSKRYAAGFDVTLHPDLLSLPYRWRKPRKVFVNSMSDIFHPEVPDDFIAAAFRTMADNPRHTFQILTKRPDRTEELADRLPWPDNVWLGVSVERARYTFRIDLLRNIPCDRRFISAEPLLEALPDLDLTGISWLIAGGESGHRPRPVSADWIRDLRDQCRRQEIPFFFKQWGGTRKKIAGHLLDGREYREFPIAMTGP